MPKIYWHDKHLHVLPIPGTQIGFNISEAHLHYIKTYKLAAETILVESALINGKEFRLVTVYAEPLWGKTICLEYEGCSVEGDCLCYSMFDVSDTEHPGTHFGLDPFFSLTLYEDGGLFCYYPDGGAHEYYSYLIKGTELEVEDFATPVDVTVEW